jgi:tyrosine-protein phosphatase SIW14
MKEQKIETEQKPDLSIVYIPPINFGMVSPGIYRSGFPNKVKKLVAEKKKKNFDFLKKIKIKTIIYMCPEL